MSGHRNLDPGFRRGDDGDLPRVPASPPPPAMLCNRCGFEVPSRAWGCKNPCPNCGTVYPLGDCSD